MPVMAKPGLMHLLGICLFIYPNILKNSMCSEIRLLMYPNIFKNSMCSVVNKKVNKKLFHKEKEMPTLDVPRYKAEFHSEMKY